MYLCLQIFTYDSEYTDTNLYIHITHTHHHHHGTQDGFSPLFVASQKGHDRIVEMLLQAGATVDLQNKVKDCYYLFICHL